MGELRTPQEHEPDRDDIDDNLGSQFAGNLRISAGKLAVLLSIALVLLLMLHFTPAGERLQDWQAHREVLAEGGLKAGLLFVTLTAGLMVFGIPRLLFFALGGYAFGFWLGLLLSLVGALMGSLVAFKVVRWSGRNWLASRFGDYAPLRRVMYVRPTVLSVALVRTLPLSNIVINIGLAMSRVTSPIFLAGTLIGFIPQGVVAALVGSGIADETVSGGVLNLALAMALVTLVAIWSWRRSRSTVEKRAVGDGRRG